MSTNKPSSTPRTDEAEFTHTCVRDGVITAEWQVVDADFARQLERELAQARKTALEEAAQVCTNESPTAKPVSVAPSDEASKKARFWDQWSLDDCKYMSQAYLAQAEEIARLRAEVKRLCKAPEDTLSDHPGCVYCMEAGTSVKDGEVCPKCGDRLPTRTERRLQAELDAANAALRDILNPWGVQGSEWYSKHVAAIERAEESHDRAP